MDKEIIEEMLRKDSQDMLDIIYNARKDDLANLTDKDKKSIKKINDKINQKYLEYKNTLDNIPNGLRITKREIIDKFNEYTETLTEREGYFNEKYYKEGLKDGINLISRWIFFNFTISIFKRNHLS